MYGMSDIFCVIYDEISFRLLDVRRRIFKLLLVVLQNAEYLLLLSDIPIKFPIVEYINR
jgi:hypothetical protein